MVARERVIERAARRSRRLLIEVGAELREARLRAGLTLAAVGRAVGLSHSQVSRIERGLAPRVALADLVAIGAVVGLDLSAKLYPAGGPIRDVAQLEQESRFRGRLHPDLRMRTEVPIPAPGDMRAWDAMVDNGTERIGVEFEMRLRDVQALERRIALKQRDSALDRVVLVVRDSHANRRALHEHAELLRVTFPLATREILAALGAGRLPPASGIVVL